MHQDPNPKSCGLQAATIPQSYKNAYSKMS